VAPKVPGGQGAVHADVVRPWVSPYRPGTQSVQKPAPAREYLPAGQMVGLGRVEPGGQAYPAVHAPTHWSVVCATASPYRPAAQLPLHADVVKPAAEPNRPATQSVQDPEPATEYLPAGHWLAVALVDPAGQAYPALHGPIHWAEVCAAALPNRPAVQLPLQADVPIAAVEPYRPATQSVHTDAPPKENLPAGHTLAEALVDAAGQMYPAVQVNEHAALVNPSVEPYTPGGQSVQAPAPAREYFPATHCDAVALVDPAGQAYPAVHAPTHWAVVWATALPKRPAAQLPVQAAVVRPAVAP
jgi:hypothetical protein